MKRELLKNVTPGTRIRMEFFNLIDPDDSSKGYDEEHPEVRDYIVTDVGPVIQAGELDKRFLTDLVTGELIAVDNRYNIDVLVLE